jgi:N-acetylglucosamine-6-phosphate deacetylase
LLEENGIICAAGHSGASWDDLSGRKIPLVTHLFNGMSGVSHKEPGLALWGLIKDDVFIELNGDGHHLHPAAVSLVLKVKNPEKIILISDAVPPAGDTSGRGIFNGSPTAVRGRGVYNRQGTLVGSRLLINDIVGKLIREYGIPDYRAVSMAAAVPNRFLGIPGPAEIAPGRDADLAVFSEDFSRCKLTLYKGRILHSSY